MGFEYINEEQKIRIALSRKAYKILTDDMEIFSVEHLTTFINKVIANFREGSMATLTNHLERIKNDLVAEFESLDIDQHTKEMVIDHMLNIRKEKAEDILNKYLKDKSISRLYHINNDNISYLRDVCSEEEFYKHSPGAYIKCILEEYADLPFVEREKIYRKEVFDRVSFACENNKMLGVSITNTDGKSKKLYIYPYKIVTDVMKTQSYLACYTREKDQPGSEKKDASFAMSRIPMPHKLEMKSFISQEDKRKIENDIEKLSVNYLLGDEVEIRVRLTEKGKTLYKNRIISRPPKDHSSSTADVYVFHCSEHQAYYYFYAFGEHAEVLSPESLRNTMIASHRNALELYQK